VFWAVPLEVESSVSDSSDDDNDSSERSSDSQSSSSDERSECLAVYLVVQISSSNITLKVTFFAAGKKARRPVRGLSPAGQSEDLRSPDGTGLFRRMPLSPSGSWYGLSSLLDANGETRREEGRADRVPVGDAVAGENRWGIS
jgi:hypothetical protein